MSETKLSKRDYIKTTAILLGAGIIAGSSKVAKAGIPGAEEGFLSAIATNTLNAYKSLKESVEVVNKHLKEAELIRSTTVNAYNIVKATEDFDKLVQSQINSFKRKLDGFYRVGQDPIANPIRQISIENEPLVLFARTATEAYEAIFKKSKNDKESRNKASGSARNRASVELAKVQAKETRANVKKVLELSLANPLETKTTAENFKDSIEPVKIDIEIQKLESQLRLEQMICDFIEEQRTGRIPEAKEFNSETFKKVYNDMKSGDGVLL